MTPVEDLLRLTLEEGSSDLHVTVGSPPTIRLNGAMTKLDLPSLTAADTEEMVRGITKDQQIALTFREDARFRISLFLQRGSIGMVARLIPNKILEMDAIGLPPAVKDLIEIPRGLILVTGPT